MSASAQQQNWNLLCCVRRSVLKNELKQAAGVNILAQYHTPQVVFAKELKKQQVQYPHPILFTVAPKLILNPCDTLWRLNCWYSVTCFSPGAGQCPAPCGVVDTWMMKAQMCYRPAFLSSWPKSNHARKGCTITDCPGAQWCPDTSLGGDALTPREHQSISSGMNINT